MAVKLCYECKQKFRSEELIFYTSPKAKNGHWYCSKCLVERESREAFANKVCEIFGIKAPGPRIWTERRALKNKYGYTDQVIIDCLDYIYNVQNTKKLAETLYLVNPKSVDQMKQYKRSLSANSGSIIAAIAQPMEVQKIEIRENTTSHKQLINPDDWLVEE